MNFILPLHKVCLSKGSETFKNIFFLNGFAYATNSCILVKSPLHPCNLLDSYLEILNGKAIPSKSYEQILTFEQVEIDDSGIRAYMNDGSREAFFVFTNLNPSYVWPDFDKLLQSTSFKSVEFIGIDPKRLKIASEVLIGGSTGIRLDFSGIDKPILVSSSDGDDYGGQMCLIQPSYLENAINFDQ